MCQYAGSGRSGRRRQRRSRCLGDCVTAPAGIFRPDMPDHPEPARDLVEDLGDVFAEPGHLATAGRGAVVLGLVHDLLTRQVIQQWLALWPVPFPDRQWPVFGGSLTELFGFAGFQLLEPQFQLLDLPGQPLRGAAELTLANCSILA
jgi:hypothetical protein